MDVRNDSVTSTETTDATETSAVVLPSSTDGIQLPEGFDLTGSVFDRVGDDLLLIDTGGTKVVVRDYLDGDAGDLIGAGGARVSGEMAAKLAGPLAPGQYAQSGTLASAELIGHVETVGGTVTATHADGTRVELSAGDPVYQGDILESAADGRVGIVLADETTFSMGAEGRMVLDEMVYDPGAQEGSLAISVLQGVFTFVSGQVAKADPDAMVLETPVATIGIRGTQAGIDIADGQNLTIVNMEESNSFVGEIVITTAAGVEILNLTNQGTSVAGLGAAPTATSIFDLSEIVGRFSGTLGYLPTNSGTGTGNSYGVEPLGQAPGGPADGIDELDDTLNLDSFDTAAGGAEEAAGQPIVEDVIPVVAGAPLVSGGPLPTIDLDIPAGGPSITGGSTTPVDGPQSETPIVGGTVPAQNEPVVVADGSIQIGNGDLIAPDAEDNLTVVGGDGANTIVTGQGDDVIVANGGDDSVNAGAGDDQVIGGSGEGDDVYVGGDGEDTLVYSSAEEGVYVDLFAGKASSIGYPTFDEIGQDQFTGFENVIGGDGDDLIFGDKGDNRLQGGAGDDVLRGGYGTDTIEGGAGDDLILADEDGDGGDGFFGENGDVYDGGDGNDTVSYAGAEDSVWAILGWDDEEWEGGEGGEEGGFAWARVREPTSWSTSRT